MIWILVWLIFNGLDHAKMFMVNVLFEMISIVYFDIMCIYHDIETKN